jgi:hypothetical protein
VIQISHWGGTSPRPKVRRALSQTKSIVLLPNERQHHCILRSGRLCCSPNEDDWRRIR